MAVDKHFGIYESKADCLVDIMANTDCGYRVATIAVEFVYEFGWQFDCGPWKRSVSVSQDFSNEMFERIDIRSNNVSR